MAPGPTPTSVDFHFDIMCPYAFQTSWWIREVRDHGGVTVNWRFFSLEEINRLEGKKHPWEREWSYGWSMMRIGALLRRDDPALLDAWYAKAGTALHVEGRKPHRPEVAQDLLVELGLDPDLVDRAIADPTTTDEVKADHDSVRRPWRRGASPSSASRTASASSGPWSSIRRPATTPLRLWELVCGWRDFPHVYELQRPKRRDDIALIAETLPALPRSPGLGHHPERHALKTARGGTCRHTSIETP